MSAVEHLARPRRIKAAHQRRWKCSTGSRLYANDNPYRYTDPDGRCAGGMCDQMVQSVGESISDSGSTTLSPVAKVGLAVMLTATGVDEVAGAAGAVRAVVRYVGAKIVAKGETEVVQRAMSKGELKATQETGLVRGGRSGIHHVSDSVNSSAGRARQRLALDNTPEVRATLKVPKGRFSSPTRIRPKYNMPGGGMERTATGKIPAVIIKTDKLTQ